MNQLKFAYTALPIALFASSLAAAQPAADPGVATGTTVATTTPSTGSPSTVTTTTYVSGPSAVTAQAAADKAKADLQTSQAQARSAQIAATNALLPTSTTSGAVTLQATAGTEEANVLAAVAINGAAERIITKIKPAEKFLIVTGSSVPDFSGWLAFDAKLEFLKGQFGKSEGDYATAEQLPPVAIKPQDITGIGEVASSLVKLAQLAATDWTAGGLALQADDYMLAVAVSARAPSATIYNQSTSIEAYQAIKTRLDDVDQARQLAARNSTAAAAESASLKVQAKKDKNDAADNDTKKAAALDAVVTELNAAVANYDSYLSQLSGSTAAPTTGSQASSASSVTLAAILQQKTGFDASQANGVLLLRVHSAAGGFYTEKNLWSSFGTMPFYASGGAVVSYSFTKNGSHSAALLEVVVPYNKVSEVKTVADMDYNGLCDTAPGTSDPTTAAFKKYCP